MNILLTSVGRRVSLVNIFKKELKKVYPKGLIYAVDIEPELSAACQVADMALKVPTVDNPDYLNNLITICKNYRITLIVPTIDTELLVLAENEKKLLSFGIKVVISSTPFIHKCRNKYKIHEFFREHNVIVAKEYTKEHYLLPLYIKPYDGSRSVSNYIIKEMNDFRDFHFTDPKLMFLEYLDLNYYDEYTCDLYYTRDHQLKCVVPRKRIEVRDGEVNKGKTEVNVLIPYIRERLAIVEGARGCLTSQFFKHKETDHIIGIEINPRFGGGFPLTYLSGANYVQWIIEEYLFDNNIADQFDCWENNLLMLRYDDEILVHDSSC